MNSFIYYAIIFLLANVVFFFVGNLENNGVIDKRVTVSTLYLFCICGVMLFLDALVKLIITPY